MVSEEEDNFPVFLGYENPMTRKLFRFKASQPPLFFRKLDKLLNIAIFALILGGRYYCPPGVENWNCIFLVLTASTASGPPPEEIKNKLFQSG